MRQVTVATTQTFCTWDEAATLDRVEAVVRRAAAAGGQVVLPQELRGAFSASTSCSAISRWRPIEGTRSSSASGALAAELGVVIPVSRLRAGQQRLLQLGRRCSMPTASELGHLPQESTSPTGRATRRSSTSTPATPASASGARGSARSASPSAGTSGFPRRRAPWRCGAEVLLYPTAIGGEPDDPRS